MYYNKVYTSLKILLSGQKLCVNEFEDVFLGTNENSNHTIAFLVSFYVIKYAILNFI